MGIFGKILGGTAGKLIGGTAGRLLGGKAGAQIGSQLGGQLGGTAGAVLTPYKKGGKVPKTGAALLHKGEFVLPAHIKPTKAQVKAVAKGKRGAGGKSSLIEHGVPVMFA